MDKKNVVLEAKNLSKKFGGVTALDGVSFKVKEKEIKGVVGPNGAGKTTLFNLLIGVYKPDYGSILFKGEEVEGKSPHEVAEMGMGRTFQVTRVFEELTVLENLNIIPSDTSEDRVLELLDLTGLTRLKDEYAVNLSFGQQKLLEIIRATIANPSLILLDEPVAGVNPTMSNKILGLINKLNEEGKSFMVIDHELDVILNLSDNIIALLSGKKIDEGTPSQIEKNEQLVNAYFGEEYKSG